MITVVVATFSQHSDSFPNTGASARARPRVVTVVRVRFRARGWEIRPFRFSANNETARGGGVKRVVRSERSTKELVGRAVWATRARSCLAATWGCTVAFRRRHHRRAMYTKWCPRLVTRGRKV